MFVVPMVFLFFIRQFCHFFMVVLQSMSIFVVKVLPHALPDLFFVTMITQPSSDSVVLDLLHLVRVFGEEHRASMIS